MKASALGLYHRLPAPARNIAASLRGRRLRQWRYGRDSEDLTNAALDRDTWDDERWGRYQNERLAAILRTAAETVPYYRAHWEARRCHGDRPACTDLAGWPVLSKEAIRNQPQAFLRDGVDRSRLECVHTSGSTGTPLTLWRDRRANVEWYALLEARMRRWNGVSRRDKWAILGGQLVVPFQQRKPPYWVWNAGLRQLYLSSYHLSADTVAAYCTALRESGVRYILGYASALHTLADASAEAGAALPPMAVAFSNAEPLYSHQRSSIERAFGCPVRDTYGMTEIAGGASECEHGRMHIWPDAGILEILRLEGDEPAEPGEAGRVVCTGLLNDVMPLIRYEVGDQAVLPNREDPCPCGRTLPVLESIEGRLDDVIVTRDGRRIGRLDPVFKDDMPIREAQIIQEADNALRVVYVPAPGFSNRHAALLVSRLRDRVGPMDVTLQAVDAIPRAANGKFRAVLSRIATAPPTS